MIDFDSLIDLKEYIKDTMQEVLENEIYEEVVKLEQEVIEDVVYGWGIPVKYVRRGYDGGIIDDSNIVIDEIRVTENGIGIDIVNNTPIKGQVEIYKNGDKFIIEDGTFSYKDISLKGIKFNVYIFNVQDGIKIDYKTGESFLENN